MERGMNKVVLVTRRTRLQELVAKYNTMEQAKFYIEHLGADFSDYIKEDKIYQQAVQKAAQTATSGHSSRTPDRRRRVMNDLMSSARQTGVRGPSLSGLG